MSPAEETRRRNHVGRPFLTDALKICLIYLVFGILWIIFSDNILLSLPTRQEEIILISSIKGILYIITTTILLFLLIRFFTRKLVERDRKMNAMTMNIPGVVYRFYANPDGTFGFDYISKRSLQVLGLENNPATFFNQVVEGIVPEEREQFIGSVQQAINTKKYWEYSGWFVKPSGEKIWVSAGANPAEEPGRIIFDGAIFDYTGWKLAEEERARKSEELAASYEELFATDEELRNNLEKLKQQEETLRESEEWYRTIFENTDSATVIIEEDTTIYQANSRFLELMGNSREEVEGKKLLIEAVVQEDQDRMLKYFHEQRIENTSVPAHFEFRFMTGTKEIRSILSTNAIIPGTKKSVASLLDITERKQAEETVRNSEKRFRAIFNSTFQFTDLLKPDGTLIEANQASMDFCRVTPDMIINKPFWESRWWSGDEKRVQDLKKAIARAAGGEFVRYEVEIQGAEDIRGLFDFSIKPVFDENGDVILLISEARDITERKWAEESLKESLDKYQRFFTTSQNCIFITTKDGRWVDLNDAAVEMFGYSSKDELLRVKIADLYVSAEDRTRHIRTIEEKGFTKEYPVDLKTKDGTVIHTLITSVVRHDRDGNAIGFQGSIRDITEQKLIETALQQARSKLNLLNSVTFTDIQNAIFSLSGYFELEMQIPMEEKLHQFIRNQIRIVRTITESLKFANYYQSLGLKPPRWQNVQQFFLLGISHLDISQLTRHLNLNGLEIYADPLLENVFFTLVENVILHGKTASEVTLRYREVPEGLILVFEDNGTGIQSDKKEKIFERQYEEKKGMGLFLTREILSITGITISETGEPGKGARFEILVPKGLYRFTEQKPIKKGTILFIHPTRRRKIRKPDFCPW